VLADTIPLYPLYALLFADAGLSGARISSLFVVWTAVGIVAEVPAGVLADRFSRRAAVVAAGVLQAAAYVAWTTAPGYAGFAVGFVLWGIGGALSSGALEALLYDGMAAAGAAGDYPRVYGRVTAIGLLCQLPAAAAATVLFAAGSYALVGWVSVGCCLGAATLATRLPEGRRAGAKATRAGPDDDDDDEKDAAGYLAVLRAGVSEAASHPRVRAAVVAVAVLTGLDGLEEYFPLMARSWGVATGAVPLALVAVPLVGAVGAAIGGAAGDLRPRTLALLFAGSVGVFCVAGVLHRPAGVVGVALAYGTYRVVLVVNDARLQGQIAGTSRATVTSVAAFGTELCAMAVIAAWALGPAVVAVLAAGVAAALPWLLKPRADGPARHGDGG
jgi:MFS family permease